VERDIFCIIPHDVGVEASFTLGRDVIGWRQSKSAGETLCERVIARDFALADYGILAGADPELDTMNTENETEMKKEVEDGTLHRIAKVRNFLEMWQGGRNLSATQKESRAQNEQKTAVGYLSDMEGIINASWSLFQHDGAAAFILSERSPLPPPLSAKDLPGGWTQILNVLRIRRINRHPVQSDEHRATESILETEDWLNWNGDFDNRNDSEDNCGADVESDIEQCNSIEVLGCPAQRDVSAAPNDPRLIRPTWESKNQAEKVSMTVNVNETRRNKGVKKK